MSQLSKLDGLKRFRKRIRDRRRKSSRRRRDDMMYNPVSLEQLEPRLLLSNGATMVDIGVSVNDVAVAGQVSRGSSVNVSADVTNSGNVSYGATVTVLLDSDGIIGNSDDVVLGTMTAPASTWQTCESVGRTSGDFAIPTDIGGDYKSLYVAALSDPWDNVIPMGSSPVSIESTMTVAGFTPTNAAPGSDLAIDLDFVNVGGDMAYTVYIDEDTTFGNGNETILIQDKPYAADADVVNTTVPVGIEDGTYYVGGYTTSGGKVLDVSYGADELNVRSFAITGVSPTTVTSNQAQTIEFTGYDLPYGSVITFYYVDADAENPDVAPHYPVQDVYGEPLEMTYTNQTSVDTLAPKNLPDGNYKLVANIVNQMTGLNDNFTFGDTIAVQSFVVVSLSTPQAVPGKIIEVNVEGVATPGSKFRLFIDDDQDTENGVRWLWTVDAEGDEKYEYMDYNGTSTVKIRVPDVPFADYFVGGVVVDDADVPADLNAFPENPMAVSYLNDPLSIVKFAIVNVDNNQYAEMDGQRLDGTTIEIFWESTAPYDSFDGSSRFSFWWVDVNTGAKHSIYTDEVNKEHYNNSVTTTVKPPTPGEFQILGEMVFYAANGGETARVQSLYSEIYIVEAGGGFTVVVTDADTPVTSNSLQDIETYFNEGRIKEEYPDIFEFKDEIEEENQAWYSFYYDRDDVLGNGNETLVYNQFGESEFRYDSRGVDSISGLNGYVTDEVVVPYLQTTDYYICVDFWWEEFVDKDKPRKTHHIYYDYLNKPVTVQQLTIDVDREVLTPGQKETVVFNTTAIPRGTTYGLFFDKDGMDSTQDDRIWIYDGEDFDPNENMYNTFNVPRDGVDIHGNPIEYEFNVPYYVGGYIKNPKFGDEATGADTILTFSTTTVSFQDLSLTDVTPVSTFPYQAQTISFVYSVPDGAVYDDDSFVFYYDVDTVFDNGNESILNATVEFDEATGQGTATYFVSELYGTYFLVGTFQYALDGVDSELTVAYLEDTVTKVNQYEEVNYLTIISTEMYADNNSTIVTNFEIKNLTTDGTTFSIYLVPEDPSLENIPLWNDDLNGGAGGYITDVDWTGQSTMPGYITPDYELEPGVLYRVCVEVNQNGMLVQRAMDQNNPYYKLIFGFVAVQNEQGQTATEVIPGQTLDVFFGADEDTQWNYNIYLDNDLDPSNGYASGSIQSGMWDSNDEDPIAFSPNIDPGQFYLVVEGENVDTGLIPDAHYWRVKIDFLSARLSIDDVSSTTVSQGSNMTLGLNTFGVPTTTFNLYLKDANGFTHTLEDVNGNDYYAYTFDGQTELEAIVPAGVAVGEYTLVIETYNEDTGWYDSSEYSRVIYVVGVKASISDAETQLTLPGERQIVNISIQDVAYDTTFGLIYKNPDTGEWAWLQDSQGNDISEMEYTGQDTVIAYTPDDMAAGNYNLGLVLDADPATGTGMTFYWMDAQGNPEQVHVSEAGIKNVSGQNILKSVVPGVGVDVEVIAVDTYVDPATSSEYENMLWEYDLAYYNDQGEMVVTVYSGTLGDPNYTHVANTVVPFIENGTYSLVMNYTGFDEFGQMLVTGKYNWRNPIKVYDALSEVDVDIQAVSSPVTLQGAKQIVFLDMNNVPGSTNFRFFYDDDLTPQGNMKYLDDYNGDEMTPIAWTNPQGYQAYTVWTPDDIAYGEHTFGIEIIVEGFETKYVYWVDGQTQRPNTVEVSPVGISGVGESIFTPVSSWSHYDITVQTVAPTEGDWNISLFWEDSNPGTDDSGNALEAERVYVEQGLTQDVDGTVIYDTLVPYLPDGKYYIGVEYFNTVTGESGIYYYNEPNTNGVSSSIARSTVTMQLREVVGYLNTNYKSVSGWVQTIDGMGLHNVTNDNLTFSLWYDADVVGSAGSIDPTSGNEIAMDYIRIDWTDSENPLVEQGGTDIGIDYQDYVFSRMEDSHIQYIFMAPEGIDPGLYSTFIKVESGDWPVGYEEYAYSLITENSKFVLSQTEIKPIMIAGTNDPVDMLLTGFSNDRQMITEELTVDIAAAPGTEWEYEMFMYRDESGAIDAVIAEGDDAVTSFFQELMSTPNDYISVMTPGTCEYTESEIVLPDGLVISLRELDQRLSAVPEVDIDHYRVGIRAWKTEGGVRTGDAPIYDFWDPDYTVFPNYTHIDVIPSVVPEGTHSPPIRLDINMDIRTTIPDVEHKDITYEFFVDVDGLPGGELVWSPSATWQFIGIDEHGGNGVQDNNFVWDFPGHSELKNGMTVYLGMRMTDAEGNEYYMYDFMGPNLHINTAVAASHTYIDTNPASYDVVYTSDIVIDIDTDLATSAPGGFFNYTMFMDDGLGNTYETEIQPWYGTWGSELSFTPDIDLPAGVYSAGIRLYSQYGLDEATGDNGSLYYVASTQLTVTNGMVIGTVYHNDILAGEQQTIGYYMDNAPDGTTFRFFYDDDLDPTTGRIYLEDASGAEMPALEYTGGDVYIAWTPDDIAPGDYNVGVEVISPLLAEPRYNYYQGGFGYSSQVTVSPVGISAVGENITTSVLPWTPFDIDVTGVSDEWTISLFWDTDYDLANGFEELLISNESFSGGTDTFNTMVPYMPDGNYVVGVSYHNAADPESEDYVEGVYYYKPVDYSIPDYETIEVNMADNWVARLQSYYQASNGWIQLSEFEVNNVPGDAVYSLYYDNDATPGNADPANPAEYEAPMTYLRIDTSKTPIIDPDFIQQGEAVNLSYFDYMKSTLPSSTVRYVFMTPDGVVPGIYNTYIQVDSSQWDYSIYSYSLLNGGSGYDVSFTEVKDIGIVGLGDIADVLIGGGPVTSGSVLSELVVDVAAYDTNWEYTVYFDKDMVASNGYFVAASPVNHTYNETEITAYGVPISMLGINVRDIDQSSFEIPFMTAGSYYVAIQATNTVTGETVYDYWAERFDVLPYVDAGSVSVASATITAGENTSVPVSSEVGVYKVDEPVTVSIFIDNDENSDEILYSEFVQDITADGTWAIEHALDAPTSLEAGDYYVGVMITYSNGDSEYIYDGVNLTVSAAPPSAGTAGTNVVPVIEGLNAA